MMPFIGERSNLGTHKQKKNKHTQTLTVAALNAYREWTIIVDIYLQQWFQGK